MRYPLVDGQGDFGSVDGDPPAAMRYCLTGDALVRTTEGLIPIGKLANAEAGAEVAIDIAVRSAGGRTQRRAVVRLRRASDSARAHALRLRTHRHAEPPRAGMPCGHYGQAAPRVENAGHAASGRLPRDRSGCRDACRNARRPDAVLPRPLSCDATPYAADATGRAAGVPDGRAGR